MTIDVIIPTLKPYAEIVPLAQEIVRTAGCIVRIIATCQKASAAVNRNAGLRQAATPLRIMVDDDISGFPQGWVARLAEVMGLYPECVMAAPRLMNLNGTYGQMVGFPSQHYQGCEILKARELVTACFIFRDNGVAFDETYIGSGFEDNDYCRQLVQKHPNAQFICVHDIKVIHRNEQKNQGGSFWEHNQSHFRSKWGPMKKP